MSGVKTPSTTTEAQQKRQHLQTVITPKNHHKFDSNFAKSPSTNKKINKNSDFANTEESQVKITGLKYGQYDFQKQFVDAQAAFKFVEQGQIPYKKPEAPRTPTKKIRTADIANTSVKSGAETNYTHQMKTTGGGFPFYRDDARASTSGTEKPPS